jgi:hypothetical protein
MTLRRTSLIVFALVATLTLAWTQSASAETYKRKIKWSGHTWKVRVAERSNPMNNAWGDATGNARVQSDGSLRLGITTGRKWRSVELAGARRLGYGRYRWVVASDMSNPSNVFALFIRDMAVSASKHGEQDIEFARWSPHDLAPGWWVSWSKRSKSFDDFAVTNRAPYVIDITWRPRSVQFFVRDADGTVLLDRQVAARPAGKLLFPRMSYWLLPDSPRDQAPPPVVVKSFRFKRL